MKVTTYLISHPDNYFSNWKGFIKIGTVVFEITVSLSHATTAHLIRFETALQILAAITCTFKLHVV